MTIIMEGFCAVPQCRRAFYLATGVGWTWRFQLGKAGLDCWVAHADGEGFWVVHTPKWVGDGPCLTPLDYESNV